MNTLRFNFNGVDVDAASSAPIQSHLFHWYPSLFSQERLKYHLEDQGRKGQNCTYRSILLGYDLEDIIDVIDLEKLQESVENLVATQQEDLDVGHGAWDFSEVRVYIKTFGGTKKYLWIKCACYY